MNQLLALAKDNTVTTLEANTPEELEQLLNDIRASEPKLPDYSHIVGSFRRENPFLCQKQESGFEKCKSQCDICSNANDKLLK